MAKQLNTVKVGLSFTADTKQAQQQLANLQSQISNLAKLNIGSTGQLAITKDLQQASNQALQLKQALIESTNVNTGKLDLTKFSKSLSAANLDMYKIRDALLTLGPTGAQTFANLATSISQAEMPLFRVSAKVRELGVTLANTARWQLSSSMLHGFMGAVQGAVGYAKDLNESLNNIRIVTGQSTDQMAQFAKEANRAAKALSATTVEYTDAALIYYQQGLSGEQVRERAETTLKMANVSRQSAETVSQQMTSVWNNFYDGGKSLEYYSDVMVALGAATASSSDEIATGLEKFSAVSNTVGLSYEYAAAALATVTAQTRQSADTVGTAFRTLFTRLEGLQLDGIADDGTTLNKYSQALAKVGVYIKDYNGQLKDMDQILDELGAKWQNISKDQQVALAQTVGGARQYATLIALMDNWDFFQENLGTAKNSTGSLERQQKIYEESWLAASDRVKAALEDIYNDVFNDKAFISITNGFANLLTGVNKLVESLGGLKGIVGVIGSMILTTYGPKIGKTLQQTTNSFKAFVKTGKTEAQRLREETFDALKTMYIDSATKPDELIAKSYSMQANAQELLLKNSEKLTEEQKTHLQMRLDNINSCVKETAELGQQVKELEKQKDLKAQIYSQSNPQNMDAYTQATNGITALSFARGFAADLTSLGPVTENNVSEFKNRVEQFKNLFKDSFGEMHQFAGEYAPLINDIIATIGKDGTSIDTIRDKIETLRDTLSAKLDDKTFIDKLSKECQITGEDLEKLVIFLEKLGFTMAKTSSATMNTAKNFEDYAKRVKQLVDENNTVLGSSMQMVGSLGRIASAAKSLSGLVDVINSKDMNGWEKFLSILTTLGFALPMLMGGFTSLQKGVIGLAASLKGAEVAALGFWKSLWAVLPHLAVAAIAITAIVLAAKKLYEWINKDKIALEKLEEASKKAAEAADQAAEAYDHLTDTLKSLEEQKANLEDLKNDTIAWKNAVAKLNAEIIELLKLQGKLSPENYYYDDDGVIHLTEEYKQQSQKEALERQQATQANSLIVDALVESQKLKNDNVAEDIGTELLNNFMYKRVGDYGETINDRVFLDPTNQALIVDKILNNGTINADEIKKIIKEVYPKADLEETYDENIFNAIAETLLSNSDFMSAASDYSNSTANVNNSLGLAGTEIGRQVFDKEIQKLNFEEQAVIDAVFRNLYAEKFSALQETYADEAVTPEQRDAYAQVSGFIKQTDGTYKDANGETVTFTDEDVKSNIIREALKESLSWEDIEPVINDYIKQLNASEKEKIWREREEGIAQKYDIDHAGYKAIEKNLEDTLPGFDELEDYDELILTIVEDSAQWKKVGQAVGETLDDLKDSLNSKDILVYQQALNDLADAITSWTGIEIDSSVAEQLWKSKDLEKALQGDLDAVISIYKESMRYQIQILPDSISEEEKQNLINEIWAFYDQVKLGNIKVGEIDVDNYPFINSLIQAKMAAGQTVEEIQQLLNEMGIEVEITEIPINGETQFTGDGNVIDQTTGKAVPADETKYVTKQDGSIVLPFVKKAEYKGLQNNFNYIPKSSTGGSQKSKKKASDEIERYHVVKEQLEDIEQELDRISKAKDRAFGGDKLKLMDDEIAKTQELLDKEQEYFDQINANYGPDRKALEAYGAKFDANGALINYDSLMNAQINAFNSSLSDEAEENYNNFKELIDKYEETDDLLAEQRQKLIDLQNEIFDLMLEKLEYSVDLKIGVSDDSIKYLEFLNELAGDGIDKAIDKIDNLGTIIGKNMDKIAAYNEGLNQMFANRGYKGNISQDLKDGKVTPEELAEMYDLTEAEVDLLREYMGNIMDITQEIQNMRKEITDQLIDAMEEINEKFDEQIDKINRAAEGMQHYRDIIDLVGQDVLGISDEMMKTFGEKQLDNSIANVKASRTKMLENEREYNEAVAELERLKTSGASEFAIEEQERVVKAAKENWDSSTSDYYDAWEDAQERVKVLFDDTIKSITDNFEKAMSGIYGNLEALQDAYDRQSEINERYLEDYEKIYELSKLNRDIGNSIDNTDNIRAKQELMKLQEEINALEESGAEISKYDLDFLRQKYELRLAEIALEEAQNAKSQVRMTRDSEGNWNYTYTANEENISKAEQNYEDTLYKTQQLTTDYIKDLENRIFQLNTDLVNALSNIDPNDAEGRQRIYDYYMGQNNYLTSQLNTALGNNANIYNQDWMNYSNATGYKISDNEKWMDSFNETTLSMLTGYSSLGDYQNAFRDNSLLMYNSINDAASEFAANTEIVMNAAGTSIETFAEDAEEAFKNFSVSTKEATDSIDGIDKEAKETFDAILEKLVEFNKAYDEQIQQTIKANQDLIKSFNALIAKEAEAKAAQNRSSSNNNNSSGNEVVNNAGGDPNPDPSPSYTPEWVRTGARNGSGYYQYQKLKTGEYIWQKENMGASYDTGGYTGVWGTTAGKLAMLHEKELVLNKQDTENILQSVNLVRQISDWISGRVNAMQYGSMLSAFGLPGDNRNVLEQMVTIHAEFPNANNRAEIEAAFDNLVNRAAQYAYRK